MSCFLGWFVEGGITHRYCSYSKVIVGQTVRHDICQHPNHFKREREELLCGTNADAVQEFHDPVVVGGDGNRGGRGGRLSLLDCIDLLCYPFHL